MHPFFLKLRDLFCSASTPDWISATSVGTPDWEIQRNAMLSCWNYSGERLDFVRFDQFIWQYGFKKRSCGGERDRSLAWFVLLVMLSHYELYGNSDEISMPINYVLIRIVELLHNSPHQEGKLLLETWIEEIASNCKGDSYGLRDKFYFRAAVTLLHGVVAPVDCNKACKQLPDMEALDFQFRKELWGSRSNLGNEKIVEFDELLDTWKFFFEIASNNCKDCELLRIIHLTLD